MKIWQVYDSQDSAHSDNFYATKREAQEHLDYFYPDRQLASIEGQKIVFRVGPKDAEEYFIYLIPHEITATAKEICRALKDIPQR